jgi:hypothetical protein
MNVTTNNHLVGYNPESAESNPQLNPDPLLCLPVFSLIAFTSDTLFFSFVCPRTKFCVFLISPIHTTHSVSSSFTGAKLLLLLSYVLKMEAARPFETLTCTYQSAIRY